jgi:hypothetical protein
MKSFHSLFVWLDVVVAGPAAALLCAAERLNVLLILVDDLKSALGC